MNSIKILSREFLLFLQNTIDMDGPWTKTRAVMFFSVCNISSIVLGIIVVTICFSSYTRIGLQKSLYHSDLCNISSCLWLNHSQDPDCTRCDKQSCKLCSNYNLTLSFIPDCGLPGLIYSQQKVVTFDSSFSCNNTLLQCYYSCSQVNATLSWSPTNFGVSSLITLIVLFIIVIVVGVLGMVILALPKEEYKQIN